MLPYIVSKKTLSISLNQVQFYTCSLSMPTISLPSLAGGETIKNINSQSGAHVELQRHPGPNPNEKVFNIRGEPGQIQHAVQMICEKAGLPYVSSLIDVLHFSLC